MIERTIDLIGHGGPVSLAVAEAGAGGRSLLLLHGFTGAKEDFTEWLDPLAELGWHVVAPDQRGHGESSVASTIFSNSSPKRALIRPGSGHRPRSATMPKRTLPA